MILDTSAILAILFDEPEREELLTKIGAAAGVAVGAPTLVETAIVLSAARGGIGAAQTRSSPIGPMPSSSRSSVPTGTRLRRRGSGSGRGAIPPA